MAQLTVGLFGDFHLLEDGRPVELPPSRKARALLAYLMLNERPVRREHLCELFWENPHDPKGALRWALSRLRRSLSDANAGRLQADRERVTFDMSGLQTPLDEVEALIESRLPNKASYLSAKVLLDQVYLAGLDIPNLNQFSLWLYAQREQTNALKVRLIEVALDCVDLYPHEELRISRDWLEAEPFSLPAARKLIDVLVKQNADKEVTTLLDDLKSRFEGAGLHYDITSDVPATKAVLNPRTPAGDDASARDRSHLARQKIQFCQTPSGVNLAYATVGSGPPLVKAANWLTHLELDWSAPIWSPLYRELARDFTFIRYDERGNGLSDWDVETLSQNTFVDDLACVVDHMALDTFPLLGISQGVAVCIDYVVANPDRVTKLILFGGYPKGWRIDVTPEVAALREAMLTLTRDGWGQENPAYRNVFSSTFMPGATLEQLEWFNDFQRNTTSPENAVRFLEAFADIDVRDKLSQIKVPTLVLHSRGDQRIDWTVGRDLAATIPNAEFVTLESDNHLLLEGEPAAVRFISVVREFLNRQDS